MSILPINWSQAEMITTMSSKTLHFYIVSNSEFEILNYLVVFISDRACWSVVWEFAVTDESFLDRICCHSLRLNRRKYKMYSDSIINSLASSEVRTNLTAALSKDVTQLISIVTSVLIVDCVYFHKKIIVSKVD